mmetsp:Transcript_53799/g.139105  ORF Transcript_53799/g.139105 Transcript_53799/m.139105 type:complete len:403 (-) Transcript_53799:188-1396(-)
MHRYVTPTGLLTALASMARHRRRRRWRPRQAPHARGRPGGGGTKHPRQVRCTCWRLQRCCLRRQLHALGGLWRQRHGRLRGLDADFGRGGARHLVKPAALEARGGGADSASARRRARHLAQRVDRAQAVDGARAAEPSGGARGSRPPRRLLRLHHLRRHVLHPLSQHLGIALRDAPLLLVRDAAGVGTGSNLLPGRVRLGGLELPSPLVDDLFLCHALAHLRLAPPPQLRLLRELLLDGHLSLSFRPGLTPLCDLAPPFSLLLLLLQLCLPPQLRLLSLQRKFGRLGLQLKLHSLLAPAREQTPSLGLERLVVTRPTHVLEELLLPSRSRELRPQLREQARARLQAAGGEDAQEQLVLERRPAATLGAHSRKLGIELHNLQSNLLGPLILVSLRGPRPGHGG